MMNDTHNNQKPPSNKQGKNFTSSERLGTCSMIAGIIGIVCSLFYLPMSLAYNQTAMPTGLVCGVIGILLALIRVFWLHCAHQDLIDAASIHAQDL